MQVKNCLETVGRELLPRDIKMFAGPSVNIYIYILKTTPTPNKNSSYGVKVGVHMPYPPFRKHCAREKIIEELFSEGLREIVTTDCVK